MPTWLIYGPAIWLGLLAAIVLFLLFRYWWEQRGDDAPPSRPVSHLDEYRERAS